MRNLWARLDKTHVVVDRGVGTLSRLAATALSIERLGRESGAFDTYIRTDSGEDVTPGPAKPPQ